MDSIETYIRNGIWVLQTYLFENVQQIKKQHQNNGVVFLFRYTLTYVMVSIYNVLNIKSFTLPNPCYLLYQVVQKNKDYKLIVDIHMIWIKRKSPIEKEIVEFGNSRKHYLTTQAHVKHLRDFIKATGIDRYEDMSEDDIESYLSSIQSTVVRETERIQIAQALFLFIRHKKLQLIGDQPKKGRGRPEKLERNYAILALRQLKYTYDEIAKEKKLNKKTVYEIVKRLDARQ